MILVSANPRDRSNGTYTLVDQELLPLRRVVDLLGIPADERVEESIEAFVVPPLCAKDTTETLCFLTTGPEVR